MNDPSPAGDVLESAVPPMAKGKACRVQPARHKVGAGIGQCPICFETPTKPPKLSSCTHVMCLECILEWAKVTNRCPMYVTPIAVCLLRL